MIPSFFSELLRTVVIMTVSGSLLSLLLLLFKPVARHRLPKSAQYILWLVVLAAFLVPVSRIAVLPGPARDIAPIHSMVERNVISAAEARDRLPYAGSTAAETPAVSNSPNITHSIIPADAPLTEEPALLARIITVLMVIYPLVFALVLIYSVGGYALFAKRLRRGYISPHSFDLHVLGALTKGRRTPKLIISNYALTPMLMGILKPVIVLPNREYTCEQLHGIFLHELTHMRRCDIAVKWLSLLACAAHWFNPLIWVTRREIDRICELSCDEAVIRNMDTQGKQNYGETLISVAGTRKIPLPVLSTTMCAEKRAVKERLAAIMKSKKHTKPAIVISALIILMAVLVACTSGAATGRQDDNNGTAEYPSDNNGTTEYPPDTEISGTGAYSSRTIEDYAHDYIQSLLPDLNVFREDDGSVTPAAITETRINTLEKVAEFDHIFPQTIELWRLDFMLQTEDIEDGNIRWGTFAPDENGWLGQHTGWNDANILLAFVRHDSGTEFLWHIPWAFELHTNTATIWGLETALRMTLELRSYVPEMTFPGNHYIVYFDMGLEYGRMFLSQPLTQGDSGIWVVERWQQIGNNSSFIRDHDQFNTMHALPYNLDMNQNFLEHAEELQRLFNAGQAPWLASPHESAYEYLTTQGLGRSIIAVYPADPNINFPTSITPHIFQGVSPGESDSADMGSSGVAAFSYSLPTDIAGYIEMAVGILRPGAARADIERYLGTPHQVQRAYDGGFSYLHNILADPDYVSATAFTDDSIDLDAFLDGRLRLIAFANYSTPDVLTSFTVFYSTQDGAVYEFRYLGDTFIQPNFDGNFFRHTRIR
ncbi:MAG: M56 family metallopeptidase [Defluviitaleaceae bacterium]|nr:M56 family metallopeptidase [Defluviitaleaceae bacterium]